jgi:hypothetical protein
MYKPSIYYAVVTYFSTSLPIYETYFLQNWLPRWNQRLTQLTFIHNWVIRGIQWMVRRVDAAGSLCGPLVLTQQFCWGWWMAQQQSLRVFKEKCNEYDLTAFPYFWLVDHNDSSTWFSVSIFSPICSPRFSFIVGLESPFFIFFGQDTKVHPIRTCTH